MVENKQVMAKNILYQMELKGVKAKDVCKALGFKQNSFSDWVNAKSYPRIDKIELMAQYFNISKADLVEERSYDIKDAERLAKNKEFIELFENVPPDVQDSVVTILKSARPKL